jgi:hypothetical protein
MEPGDITAIDAIEQHACDKVGACSVKVPVRGRLEYYVPAIGGYLESAGAGMVVSKRGRSLRNSDSAIARQHGVRENLGVGLG